jgi:hypothetical protein
MGFDDEYDDDKTVYGFPGNDGDAPPLPEDEVWLVVINTGQKFPIPDGSRKTVGRGKDQDIPVIDKEKRISRQHFILSRNGKEIEIEVTGLNGVVVNDQLFPQGKRVVEFPPFRMEFGDIVMDLDIDLTVTQNFHSKPAMSPMDGGRRAEDESYAPPQGDRGAEGRSNPLRFGHREGRPKPRHPGGNREGDGPPHNFGRRAEDRDAPFSSRNRGEGNPPQNFGRRAEDRWTPPPTAEHLGDGRHPANTSIHAREPEKPQFEESQAEHFSPGRGYRQTNHFTSSSPTNLHPENPLFAPSSVPNVSANDQQFEPVPVGSDDSPAKIKRPKNTLGLGIAVLSSILFMVMILYFLWPKAPVETPPASTTPDPLTNSQTNNPSAQATSDFDQLMVFQAERNIETGNYEDAVYYLNRIPKDSPLSNRAIELIRKVQRLEENK